MKLNLILISAVAFATLSLSAEAQVITLVTDETLFDTAVNDQYVDNFNFVSVGGADFYAPYTDTAGSFADSYSGGDIIITDSNDSEDPAGPVGNGDGSGFLVGDSRGAITFTANSGYSAIGANLFAVNTFTNDVPFTVVATSTTNPSDVTSHTFNLILPGATGSPSDLFAGFVAPEGYDITSISYPPYASGPEAGNGPGIDNFTAGIVDYSVSLVPEPSSLGLLLIGSLLLGGWMRVRARRS